MLESIQMLEAQIKSQEKKNVDSGNYLLVYFFVFSYFLIF